MKRRALVLQGGGALGAYEYGVIKALYEQPDFHLDVVTGVSIGAINAAILVGAKTDPLTALDDLWRQRFAIRSGPLMPPMLDRYSGMLANPGMYWMRPSYAYAPLMAPFIETSIYDTKPLHWTLAHLLDLQRLNSSPIHLAVSSVNIQTGEATYFENRTGAGLTIEQIVASAGLAPSFPMTSIGESWYWDGGFSSNLPLSKAINLLEGMDADERELIVIELFPMQAKVPTNLMEVQDRITELIFSSKLTLDKKLFDKINAFVDLISAIDEELPPESKLRQLPGYQDLRSHKKIDSFRVITSTTPEQHSGASDFSEGAIERRIAAGYQDCRKHLALHP